MLKSFRINRYDAHMNVLPVIFQHLALRRLMAAALIADVAFLRAVPLAGFVVVFAALSSVAEDVKESPATIADAAEAQDITQIQIMLTSGADLNAAQADGMTAMHWATVHDDAKLVDELVTAGAKADAKNRYGVTPLVLACSNGNQAIVDSLLRNGADPNVVLEGGETVLMTAARTGRPEVVKSLIAAKADINAKDQNAQTAIMWAAADGHAEVVSLLIGANADFRTPLKSGFTPLLFAVREGRTEVVRTLLNAGADVNEALKTDSTSGRAPRNGTSPLILAIENGHFELALELVKAGADPNDQRSGFTALHTMSWVRKPNRGDGEDGEPPPSGSGKLTSLQFVEEIVKLGADVNSRLQKGSSGPGRLSRKGATPFLMAADTADVPFMRVLIKLGANAKLANADGATPLMAAAGLGTLAPGEEAGTEDEMLEAVRFVLELGGEVNTVDKNGETAMHGAAYNNAPRIVKLLAEKGADVSIWNRPNKHGWTPVSIAEGHRPGNFKPSPATVAALQKLLAGVSSSQ